MKTFLVKQKFRLGGERFDIKDEMGNVAYQVEGSFFKIPKTFTIYDAVGEQVSGISKEILTFMPRFEIQLSNGVVSIFERSSLSSKISMSSTISVFVSKAIYGI